MNRLDAIKTIVGNVDDETLLIHANGAISRESFFVKNRARNFYLLGSMGLAASVGLGLSLTKPERRIIILDGDGNILMGLGNLAMIGAYRVNNLVHIVLDNRVYGTTGNQPTISPAVDLAKIAESCGFKTCFKVDSEETLTSIMTNIEPDYNPSFIQVFVSENVKQTCPRIPFTADEIKTKFSNSFG